MQQIHNLWDKIQLNTDKEWTLNKVQGVQFFVTLHTFDRFLNRDWACKEMRLKWIHLYIK